MAPLQDDASEITLLAVLLYGLWASAAVFSPAPATATCLSILVFLYNH